GVRAPAGDPGVGRQSGDGHPGLTPVSGRPRPQGGEEEGARSDLPLLRQESSADALRRVLAAGLSDRQWGDRRGLPPPDQGSYGTSGGAWEAGGCPGDARPPERVDRGPGGSIAKGADRAGHPAAGSAPPPRLRGNLLRPGTIADERLRPRQFAQSDCVEILVMTIDSFNKEDN